MDLTTALARLLSETKLREEYRRDRQELTRRLSIPESDLLAFLSIDPIGLEAQAKTLVNKRLNEVSRVIPETYSKLGERGRKYFLDYVENYWPRGHRRHLEDAAAFCRYLVEHGVRDVSHEELNRLQFAVNRKRFAIHLVPDFLVNGRARHALQILYRDSDHSPRQFVFHARMGSGASGRE